MSRVPRIEQVHATRQPKTLFQDCVGALTSASREIRFQPYPCSTLRLCTVRECPYLDAPHLLPPNFLHSVQPPPALPAPPPPPLPPPLAPSRDFSAAWASARQLDETAQETQNCPGGCERPWKTRHQTAREPFRAAEALVRGTRKLYPRLLHTSREAALRRGRP